MTRRLREVPIWIYCLISMSLIMQMSWHATQSAAEVEAAALPTSPNIDILQVLSLGDPIMLAKGLMLWLQAFDYQSGRTQSFRNMDYNKVITWLNTILTLDPRGQYPLLAASRLYAEVPVREKKKMMLEFVFKAFFQDPQRRWPWLAQAALTARHQLQDLPLAARYARTIAKYATADSVPHWAQQMEVFILEEMGEIADARFLVGGLLTSGHITAKQEIRFWQQYLDKLDNADHATNQQK